MYGVPQYDISQSLYCRTFAAYMSLTSLSAGFALAFSAGLWLWPPQPQLIRESAPAASPPTPSVFDCRCECPAPTPAGSPCPPQAVEILGCSWTTIVVAFLAGCLVTALSTCVCVFCRRAPAPTEIVVTHPQQFALPAPQRLAPKAITPSQRRAAFANRG